MRDIHKELDEINRKLTEEMRTVMPEVQTTQQPKPYKKVDNVKVIQKIKDYLWPSRSILIIMQLRNGMDRTFIISEKNDEFKFMGSMYIIDSSRKRYSLDDKMYVLHYHQDFSLAIDWEFPVEDIKKAVKHSNICEVEASTNPHILEDFVERKVIEQVMSGQDIRELLKPIKVGVLVAAIAAVGHLILFAVKSGMLSSVKIPGVM